MVYVCKSGCHANVYRSNYVRKRSASASCSCRSLRASIDPVSILPIVADICMLSFILGKAMEEVIPGTNPNSRFPLRDSWWARFLNPGPFSMLYDH